MTYHNPNYKHCRWDGKGYYATKPVDRDGFCRRACKQAHHRAYKKYVTGLRISAGSQVKRPVTRKKRKKVKK